MQAHQFPRDKDKAQNMSILAMTVCCVDVYPQNNTIYVGGNSINFAVRCIKNGISYVSVLGAVGTDDYGWAVINCLAANHIDLSRLYIREGRTASNKIYISESGERYFLPDSWDGGVYQSFLLSDADWERAGEYDIVAIPANNPNFNTALHNLGGRGKLVVDFLDLRDTALVQRALPGLTLGFISGDEVLVDSLQPLSLQIEAPIIVTLGAAGSVALHQGNLIYQAAIPVDEIIDTTGCGDNFQAAFAVSWFQNHDLATALRAGASAAAEVLGHFGGVSQHMIPCMSSQSVAKSVFMDVNP